MAEEKKVAVEEKLSKPVPIKKGDYSVHIFLEEGRGLVPLPSK